MILEIDGLSKYNFFRLKQIETVIQNRITVSIRINAQNLVMFCRTLICFKQINYVIILMR